MSSQSKSYFVQVPGPVTINGANVVRGDRVDLTDAQARAWGSIVGPDAPKINAPKTEAAKASEPAAKSKSKKA